MSKNGLPSIILSATNTSFYNISQYDLSRLKADPNNIRHGSSLSDDQFQGQRFDYMITNPPFGVNWKSDADAVKAEAQTATGRFSAGTPRASDGALLFLQHILSKMEDRGSRVGIVFNGSPPVFLPVHAAPVTARNYGRIVGTGAKK